MGSQPVGIELSTRGESRVFRWGIKHPLKNNTVPSRLKKYPRISLSTVKTLFFKHCFLQPNFDLVQNRSD